MLIEERKAQSLVIIDRRDLFRLRKYLNEKERTISRPVKDLWKRQAGKTTVEIAKAALEAGRMPEEWNTYISKTIREFVRDDITPAWIQSIGESGEVIAKRVNRLQRKQFDFDSTATSVKGWVDNQGGQLIVNLTEAQMTTIHALLQDQIAMQVTSPYILAQRLKPMIGLTNRETLAVIRFMHSLTEEGLSPSAISAQVEKYTNFLHNNRASRIARTELSDAYNFGQLDSLRQARSADWLPGEPEKMSIAGGANPCEPCIENESVGYIALDSAFPSGDEHPTYHPSCECGVSYRVRR